MALQIKRGLEANLPATAADGEFLYATDTQNLYIGDGGSPTLIATDLSGAAGTDSAEVVSIINSTVDSDYITALGFAQGGGSGGTETISWQTPQDFGAVGDGVADDTQAIQDWLEAGGELYAPEGTYLIAVQAGDDGVRADITGNINVVCHPEAIFKAGLSLGYDMIQIKADAASYALGEEHDVFWNGGQFDMRDQCTSTSVPFSSTFPAAGAGGRGTSAICDGLSIRGQVGDNTNGVAGFRKVQVRNVRCYADDPSNPHWQRSGGDSGIFVAGTIHQDVSNCTFFGIRDLGIYGSGVSTGVTVPKSSAVFRNNVFVGCFFGVSMKRDMDNIIMTGNIGINCGGVCTATDAQTPRAGANNLFANNIGTNCSYVVNLKLATECSVYNNASYEHGHRDQNGNEFNDVFDELWQNACVLIEGSSRCDIANNVVHSVAPSSTVDVYTVLLNEDTSSQDGVVPATENFVHDNVGRGVRSVVKDVPGSAVQTQAWSNVGRDKSVANSPNVDLNKGTAGGVDRDGPFAEDYNTVSHTGTTSTTELKSGTIKAGSLSVGEKIKITATGTVVGTAGTKQLGLRLKALANRAVTLPASAEGPFSFTIEVTIRNTIGAVAGDQIISGIVVIGSEFGTIYAEENGELDLIDYSPRLVVKLGNVNDTVNVETFRIEYA